MNELTALVLVNLGTPSSVKLRAVRSFLAEFLMDAYVLQIPWIARAFLVYGLIIPFRSSSTQAAYAAIWDESTGSPLLHHSRNLTHQVSLYLNQHYPNQYDVQLAMRYAGGSLSLQNVLNDLKKRSINNIILLPLYPHYAASTTESTIQLFLKVIEDQGLKDVRIIRDFYDHPAFIQSLACVIQESLSKYSKNEYLLFSFHGLPQEHVKKTGCENCPPDTPCPLITQSNRWCYRAQCFATVRALVTLLGLEPGTYGVSFQSRLGRLPWIGPYTDEIIEVLAQKGIQHLAVVSPAFITDCLETKEEIEIRLQESWFKLVPPESGATFSFIPCLNDHSQWVAGIAQIIHNK